MHDVDTSRREALALMASSLAAAAMPSAVVAAVAKLTPTPAQAEGPFYPVVDFSAAGNDLITAADGGRASGQPLSLSGAVLNTDGQPVAGAVVEIWQVDNNGYYRHPRDREGQVDPAFKGFGTATTDDTGQYEFLTIVPPPYPGRPPHIHLKVKIQHTTLLTTQLYFRGDVRNGRDVLLRGLSSASAERLMLAPRAAIGSRRQEATADIVVVT